MDPQSVVQTLLRTEKGTAQESLRKYRFAVRREATKVQIRQAVEALYQVQVAAVNTAVVYGKPRRLRQSLGRRPDWKQAIVTLRDGFKIETAS